MRAATDEVGGVSFAEVVDEQQIDDIYHHCRPYRTDACTEVIGRAGRVRNARPTSACCTLGKVAHRVNLHLVQTHLDSSS